MNDGETIGVVEVTNPDVEIGGHNEKSVQEFAVEPAPILAVSGKRHRETTPVEDRINNEKNINDAINDEKNINDAINNEKNTNDAINNEKNINDAIDMEFSNADDPKIPDASSSVAPNATCTNGQVTITRQREEEQELNAGVDANAEQWSPSHLNRALLSQAWKLDFPSTKKKLLILDVNGLLVARYTKIDRDIIPMGAPYGVVSRSYMFKRPFCDSFLAFCFENFDVGFWSSMRETNVVRALDFICQGMRASCRFVMHQGDCTITGLRNPEKHSQPLFLKELVKVWSKFPQFNESNTLLVDDTPYKALRNTPHTAIFPEAYFYNEADTFLKGPLVEYLTQLRDAVDVREFVRTHPIGMPAIAPGCLYWDVYQQALETRTENVSPFNSQPPVAVVPQTSSLGWDRAGRGEELREGAFSPDVYQRVLETSTANASPLYSHSPVAAMPQMPPLGWDRAGRGEELREGAFPHDGYQRVLETRTANASPFYSHPPVAVAPQASPSGWDCVGRVEEFREGAFPHQRVSETRTANASPLYSHPPVAMMPQMRPSGWDRVGRVEEFREGAFPHDGYQRVLETRTANASPFYSHPPVAVVPQPSRSGWDRAGRGEELRRGAFPHNVYQRVSETRTANASPFYSHPRVAVAPQASRSGWDRAGRGEELRRGAFPHNVYQRVSETRTANASPFYSHPPVAVAPQTSRSGWDRAGRGEERRE